MTNKRLLEPHDRQTELIFPEEAPSLSKNIVLNNQRELQTELAEKLGHTGLSEGYETMTEYSSDIVSEVKHI